MESTFPYYTPVQALVNHNRDGVADGSLEICVVPAGEGLHAIIMCKHVTNYVAGFTHVLDHTNYRRWLSVCVRDMVELAEKHPEVYAEFTKANFIVQMSDRKFSLMAKDQSHE